MLLSLHQDKQTKPNAGNAGNAHTNKQIQKTPEENSR